MLFCSQEAASSPASLAEEGQGQSDETARLPKLHRLTLDQLLAVRLLHRGLLTLAQIRTLGRIQRELHAIGLAYTLEQLVLLFRLVTAEQVQAAISRWQ